MYYLRGGAHERMLCGCGRLLQVMFLSGLIHPSVQPQSNEPHGFLAGKTVPKASGTQNEEVARLDLDCRNLRLCREIRVYFDIWWIPEVIPMDSFLDLTTPLVRRKTESTSKASFVRSGAPWQLRGVVGRLVGGKDMNLILRKPLVSIFSLGATA